ncbi:MAG: hypothetical protein MZU84_08295 [Sphingobacterium sp.]|nr:hypothetical protein [Sphingobacterium sp.]
MPSRRLHEQADPERRHRPSAAGRAGRGVRRTVPRRRRRGRAGPVRSPLRRARAPVRRRRARRPGRSRYSGQGPGLPRHAPLLQRRSRLGRPGGDGHAAAARPADRHGPLLRRGDVRLRRELPPRARAAPAHARGQPGRGPQPRRLPRSADRPLGGERPVPLPGARRPSRRISVPAGPRRQLHSVLFQRPDARPDRPDARRLLGADRPHGQVRHRLDGRRRTPLWDIYYTYIDADVPFHYFFDDPGRPHLYPAVRALRENWIRLDAAGEPFVSLDDLPRGAREEWDAFWKAYGPEATARGRAAWPARSRSAFSA